MKNKRDIDLLYEIGSLTNLERGWRQHFGTKVANVPEHSFRVIWLALILARMEGVEDEEKIIKMAMVHDLAEIRSIDLSYVQKVYVEADEKSAAKDTFEGTLLEDFYNDMLEEYEKRKSIEAKIVKDADNLDIDIELKELEERGSKLPAKKQKFREQIRKEKLYTDSARSLWDQIQESDPADWHLNSNKWLKIPNAGK